MQDTTSSQADAMDDASASSSTHVATQPPLKQARIESGLKCVTATCEPTGVQLSG